MSLDMSRDFTRNTIGGITIQVGFSFYNGANLQNLFLIA